MKHLKSVLLCKCKLAALWVVRILFAPNHFKMPLHTRLRYSVAGGYMVDQAAMYDFKHNDKREYLSEFDWHRSRCVPNPFTVVLDNKVIFSEMVGRYCATPELFAVKNNGKLTGMGGRHFADCEALLDFLLLQGAFVLKPIDGGKGTNVKVVRQTAQGLSVNNRPADAQELLAEMKKRRSWFASAYAHQAPYLDAIYPNAANTVRMIVLRSAQTGQFELAYAVQRLGTDKTGGVDNGSKGGLIAWVDIPTGVMTEARSLHTLDVHTVHPDTKAPIRGVTIPNWDAIKSGVMAASAHFPYLDMIAWDILPTADGFTVIEGNATSGVNIVQLWGGQRNGKLGRFYREHGYIH